MKEQVVFRFLRKQEGIYIRKEDVVKYLLEIAEAEETDVRNRMKEAAKNVEFIGSNSVHCPK